MADFPSLYYRLTCRRMHDDAPPREIDITTAEGDICINEDELPTVTDAELARFRLTREELNQLFAMGVELMRGKTVRDRVRRRNLGRPLGGSHRTLFTPQ